MLQCRDRGTAATGLTPFVVAAGSRKLVRPRAAADWRGVGQTPAMQNLKLPPHLKDAFFDSRWETSKLWVLPTPVSSVSLAELAWQLELSVWSTVRGEPRFDLSPKTVLTAPACYSRHWSRICEAPLEYPLELFQKRDRWVIVDGYHRLAKHWLQSTTAVPVRLHPAALWREVRPGTHDYTTPGS